MDEICNLIEAGDFESARRALRDVYRPEKYHPPVHRQALRDVRQEWRQGSFAVRQRHARGGVTLTWSRLPSGGVRPWFECPDCARRCTLLFHGRCRCCEGIRYQSQYDVRLARIRAKVTTLRQRLGWYGGLFDVVPSRPKGMRHTTYRGLLNELESLEVEAAKVIAPDVPPFAARVVERFNVVRQLASR